MYSKILVLRFPKTEVQKPIVCNLARDFAGTSRSDWYLRVDLMGIGKIFDVSY